MNRRKKKSGGFFGSMFSSAKNFVSKNKGGILNAAKSMVGGDAAAFIDIG